MKKTAFLVLIMFSILALIVSADPVLYVIGNKEVNESSTLTFDITSTFPDNGTSVFSHNGVGTLIQNNETSATFSWNTTYNDAGIHEVIFTVNDTNSSYSEPINITVNDVNRAPIANAGVDQSVLVNATVTLDGSASSDQDNGTITYLWAQTAGTLVNLSNKSAVNPTFTPTVEGTYIFQLTASDEELNSTDNVTITVTKPVELKLAITDLDVKVDGESDKNLEDGDIISEEARAESKVEFKLKVENLYTDEEDIKIENILVTITIKDIDDGDDLDEESDEFDLKPEDTETVTLNFDIPSVIDEDLYDVIIEVEGEDENGKIHKLEWNLQLETKKAKHDITIRKATLSPSVLRCTQTSELYVELWNIGSTDEDEIRLEIKNYDLGLNVEESGIELQEDSGDERHEKTVTISLDEGFPAGTYPITINAYYDDTKSADSQTVDLIVEECRETVITPPEEEEEEEEEVEVITGQPKITQPETKISFRDSNAYTALLIFLAIVVLIAIATLVISAMSGRK